MTRRFIVRIITAVILVVVAYVLVRGHRPLDRGTAWMGTFQRPMVAATMTVAGWSDALRRVIRDPSTVRELDAEVATLRARTAELAATITALHDVQREGADAALVRSGIPIVGWVVAGVLEPLVREVTIEYQAGDVVRVGDPVLARGALIGTVSVAGSSRAIVQLLTDHHTRLGVQLATTPGTVGVLEANPGGGVVVTRIPSDRVPSLGDFVVSGITNPGVPPGIPIGRIAAIRIDPDGFFRTAALDLIADPTRTLALTILAQHRP